MQRVISIIGSGIGGLAIGCRLAAKGHRVFIYEKNEQPGGKTAGFEMNRVRFQSGPSILRTPQLLDDLYRSINLKREDHIELIPLNPHFRIFDEQNHYVQLFDRPQDTINSFSKINLDDADRLEDFFTQARKYYETSFDNAPQPSSTSIQSIVDSLRKTQLPLNLEAFAAQFVKDPFLRSALTFHPILFGQNPTSVQSRISMLHTIEQQWGVHYIVGGMQKLIDDLVRVFESFGGKIFTNHQVAEILTRGKQTIGLRLGDGSIQHCDYVISNLSPYQTFQKLLKAETPSQPLQKLGHSYFILNFATDRRYPNLPLLHHNIFSSRHFPQTFRQIHRDKKLPKHLWLYLQMPGRTDSTLTESDSEIFTAIVPVPNLTAPINWQQSAGVLRNRLLSFLETRYIPDLRRQIIAEQYLTPIDLADDYWLASGSNETPYQKSRYDHLYFVGDNTFRGLGLSGAFSSAEEVSILIDREEQR
ncbi:MAG: phytoene desaturase [Anaerolineaceae bacterium]|nr:phytoene desaturase [Anaerolineaceae bacterium]